MNSQYKNSTSEQAKGFTIIEVVLVLAIAGLIFLMVFIALPALQRGQRDAQRKQDLSRVSVQLTNYLASSRGSVPDDDDALKNFVKGYLGGTSGTEAGDDYKDPNGNNYIVDYDGSPEEIGQIRYKDQTLCDATKPEGVEATTAKRDFTLLIKLENQEAPFCIDNKS